jgi:predicted TIM-barrel fold metal-dependent hydrolase
MTLTVDTHQHLWPEPLVRALARRRRPPYLRLTGDGWDLYMEGEQVWPVGPRDHDPDRRAALVREDGLDLAVVALSSPLGIEALPPDEAAPLIDAYHEGVRALPAGLAGWASAGLAAPDPAALGRALDDGLVGLTLPAGAFAGPGGAERIAPLLDVLVARDRPVFIHPGPAPWAPVPAASAGAPSWWPALTLYVAQMHSSWFGFVTWVRPAYPSLRVSFAMLAGLAPLHHERLASRGARIALRDPNTFYDTSSYGRDAAAALAAVVGSEALVFGSDRPVVPLPGVADPTDPSRGANARRLLALTEETR